MAFVNEYLTNEEREKFKKAKIVDPRWHLPKYCLNPQIWTVDRNRGIALINCGISDRENHEIKTFIFIDTQIEKQQILSFDLRTYYLDDEKEEKLAKTYGVNLVKNWEIMNLDHSSVLNMVRSYKDFIVLLTEALTVYGINGDPKFISNVKVFVTENN